MRFGVQIEPQFGFSYNDVREISDKALDNGCEVVWFSDHFMLNADATDKILLDPWLLMAALVRDNEKIRVGSLVFCNSYRNPALHAKMGATIDVLSNGRLEFGIGAGWKKLEYKAYGYDFPNFPTRAEQLSEAIQIIRGIWTEDKFSFTGDHYQTNELVSFPKPVQKPNPTIWVGSNMGGPMMIELAARYGDGLNVAWGFDPKKTEAIFRQLTEFAEKHERRPEDILKSVGCWTRILESESEMDEKIKKGAASRGVSVEAYRKRVDSSLWGTPEIVADRLGQYKDQGVSDIILMFPYGEKREQIEVFGEKVLPLV
ncbi:MAG: LLM class flavin-dependent oxidoreductase [Candidatus Thorarchaeota archaeon]|jgi:alkanesulfonate monooxygenase SsuD/methylene tetrahydromethanopterin reductase-like flavin-dependent oxidoreductase (luciferase family)